MIFGWVVNMNQESCLKNAYWLLSEEQNYIEFFVCHCYSICQKHDPNYPKSQYKKDINCQLNLYTVRSSMLFDWSTDHTIFGRPARSYRPISCYLNNIQTGMIFCIYQWYQAIRSTMWNSSKMYDLNIWNALYTRLFCKCMIKCTILCIELNLWKQLIFTCYALAVRLQLVTKTWLI
jgi:hypothetical protein